MSTNRQAAPGPRRNPGGRPERPPGAGRRGQGRWSDKHKMAVVVELLRGEELESQSRKYAVRAATVAAWRDAFFGQRRSGSEDPRRGSGRREWPAHEVRHR